MTLLNLFYFLSIFSKFVYIFIYMYVCVCHVCVVAIRDQKRALDDLELKLQVAANAQCDLWE